MRLFHFCHTYITQTETFLYRFVQRSLAEGEVSLFTFNLANVAQFYPQGSGRLRLRHLPPFRWRPRSLGDVFRYLHSKVPGRSWQCCLRTALRQEQPDLVHCHFGQMGVRLMEALAPEPLPVKYVVSFYGADASVALGRDPHYAQALPRLWQSATGFLVEGPALGRRLAALGAPESKLRICPLLVPIQDYAFKPPAADFKRGIRFLLIGRFVEKKGFHLFFDCLGQVKDQLPPFTVTAIGGGGLEARYREIIRQHGYEDRVRFLGFRPHQECLALLAEHDLLVQTSLTAKHGDSEGGAPTILIEAQALGIPVICSTHADIPFVMGYSELQMVENQPESLKEILLSLPHRTDWPELARRGRRKVEAQHDAATAPSPYRPFVTA